MVSAFTTTATFFRRWQIPEGGQIRSQCALDSIS